MIQSIKFLNPVSVKLPKGVFIGYEFNLPSLRGKTYEFAPGVNVVVGKNGSGKTSMLNVLRTITNCKGQFGSDVSGYEYWEMHIHNLFELGYWHLTEVKSPFRRATINLRNVSDIECGNEMSSGSSFSQSIFGRLRSNGEQRKASLNMMTAYLLKGEIAFRKENESIANEKKYEHLSFKKMVLDVIENRMEKCNDYYKNMFSTLLDYYKHNTSKEENKGSKGEDLTILMDEPDLGLDIDNVEKVYKFITEMPTGYQIIVVLHNVGMIHKLKEWGKANFIELTEGYVDKVEEFFV